MINLLKMMEVLYSWNEVATFLIGLSVNIVIVLFSRFNKVIHRVLFCFILIFTLLVTVFINYLHNEWLYVPEIGEKPSLNTALTKLAPDFDLSDDYLRFDAIAESMVIAGNGEYNLFFKVTKIEPASGTFVKRNSEITIWVTWENTLSSTSIMTPTPAKDNTSSGENQSYTLNSFDADKYYQNYNPTVNQPFNTDQLTLFTDELGLKMITDQMTHILGVMPSERIQVKATLIDFYSHEIVDEKIALLGNQIPFTNIPDGTYYYTVYSEGFELVVPDSPFQISSSSNKEVDVLPWSASLISNNAVYESPFRVQILTSNGSPMALQELSVRVIESNNPQPNSYSSYPVRTDENGFLTTWININGMDYYDIVDFQLLNGFTLQVTDLLGNFIEVPTTTSDIATVVM